MPIALPAVSVPAATGTATLSPWFKAFITTPAGFSYDVSKFLKTVDITRGRTSATQATIAGGTCTCIFDDTAGTFDSDNTGSPLYGKLIPGPQSATTFRLQALVPSLGGQITCFTGPFDSLERTFTGGDYSESTATFVDSTPELTRHIPPAGLVLPAELPGARITRLLTIPSRSGFTWTSRALVAPTRLDTGQKMLAALTCDGTTSSWTLAQNAAAAEGGLLFFDKDGVLVFHGQARRLTQTPRWVFSDVAGQTHYESGLMFRTSTDDLILDAAVTTSDGVTSIFGPGGLTQTTATSVTADLTETSQLGGNISGASRARFLYSQRAVPRRNSPTLIVNAAPSAGLWTAAGGQATEFQAAVTGNISDLATVTRHPYQGTVISQPHWIEGYSMSAVAGQSWVTTFNVSRADPIPPGGYWQLGLSQLGLNTTLTW